MIGNSEFLEIFKNNSNSNLIFSGFSKIWIFRIGFCQNWNFHSNLHPYSWGGGGRSVPMVIVWNEGGPQELFLCFFSFTCSWCFFWLTQPHCSILLVLWWLIFLIEENKHYKYKKLIYKIHFRVSILAWEVLLRYNNFWHTHGNAKCSHLEILMWWTNRSFCAQTIAFQFSIHVCCMVNYPTKPQMQCTCTPSSNK